MTDLVHGLQNKRYAFSGPNLYDASKLTDLKLMTNSYSDLPIDPDPGNRCRAYARFSWKSGELTLDAATSYVQPQKYKGKQYNYDAGDRIRHFEPIKPTVLQTRTLRHLIERHLQLCQATLPRLFKNHNLEVGLHQVRYRATHSGPSYANPVWRHKDIERYVAIILMSLSPNACGGDNLIFDSGAFPSNLLQLRAPLDTLVLGPDCVHAVTPVGTCDKYPAHRDVLLVTFTEPRERDQRTAA